MFSAIITVVISSGPPSKCNRMHSGVQRVVLNVTHTHTHTHTSVRADIFSRCLSDVRQVAAGCKHSADHPAGAGLRGSNPPPLGRPGYPCVLQTSLRVPTPGLHGVVSTAAVDTEPHPESGQGIGECHMVTHCQRKLPKMISL